MMNIQFDKKTAITISGIALAVTVFAVMVIPLFNKVGRVGSEVKALEQEMISARQAIQSQNKFRQTGNLLTRREISLAIDEMTKMGALEDISFVSISPQKISKPKDSKYPVLPIQMELQSEYKDLGVFLGALNELKESIITVESFQVEADQQSLPQINTSLVVEVYLREGEDG